MTLGRKLVVEFIGTFFLVFTVCMATNPKTGADGLAPHAIGAGLIRGKITSNEWVAYIIAQLVAAVAAALVARAVSGAGSLGAFNSTGVGKILLVEFLFTFGLAYVVLNVATAAGTEGNSFYGLAIGFTVAAGAFAVGGVSGGAFNPAVALGASVLGIFKWSHYWIYIVGPILGGAVAAGAFLYVQPAEKPGGDVEAASAGQ